VAFDKSIVGPQVQQLRGILSLKYPIDNGIIQDYDDQEKVWNYLYNEELKVQREDHPVLMTEPPLNPISQKKKILQIFFETFQVPAMYFAIPAVLSLYACGAVTGCVLDVGDTVTHVVSVYEGYTMPHTTQRSDIAGRKVTSYLQRLLRRSGHSFHTSSEREIVREIKEKKKMLRVSPVDDPEKLSRFLDEDRRTYILPDGTSISLAEEQYMAPELLFKPHLIGSEQPGAHELLNNCILSCDVDIRSHLYKNIFLAGGSTLFEQFGKRMLYDLRAMSPKDTNIMVYAPPERKYTTWIGASILADLSSFRSMWITAEQYDEYGASIAERYFKLD